MVVYDPSAQLIFGGGDGEEQGAHFCINILGFVFPKNWQHSFKCLCPDPVLQVLRQLCTSVLSYTFRQNDWLRTWLDAATPHSQQGDVGRQPQSVLLLSTHLTGKNGQKYPQAVLILPRNLKCWVSKQVAGTQSWVFGISWGLLIM